MIRFRKVAAGLAATFAAAVAPAQDQIQVQINGQTVQFGAAEPEMVGGRILVPFRGVFEELGSAVRWDPQSRAVIAAGNGHHVELKIGSYDASVDGRVVTTDVAPEIQEGTTMVPLRFLSQALGGRVDWQPQNDLVAITTTPLPPPPASRPQQIVVPPPTVIIEHEPAKPTAPPATRPPAPPALIVARDAVIPMRLDEELNSEHDRIGEEVSAGVLWPEAIRLGLPEGTRVVGYVRDAATAGGSHGGRLDIRFTHFELPDGSRYDLRGVVTRLDDPFIVQTADGGYAARGEVSPYLTEDSPREGAELYSRNLVNKPVGGAAIGGSFGEFLGIFDHGMAHNVIIPVGTRLGLILDRPVKINRADLH